MKELRRIFGAGKTFLLPLCFVLPRLPRRRFHPLMKLLRSINSQYEPQTHNPLQMTADLPETVEKYSIDEAPLSNPTQFLDTFLDTDSALPHGRVEGVCGDVSLGPVEIDGLRVRFGDGERYLRGAVAHEVERSH
jgi:hypothetical protein